MPYDNLPPRERSLTREKVVLAVIGILLLFGIANRLTNPVAPEPSPQERATKNHQRAIDACQATMLKMMVKPETAEFEKTADISNFLNDPNIPSVFSSVTSKNAQGRQVSLKYHCYYNAVANEVLLQFDESSAARQPWYKGQEGLITTRWANWDPERHPVTKLRDVSVGSF